jgi:hypothetical protein
VKLIKGQNRDIAKFRRENEAQPAGLRLFVFVGPSQMGKKGNFATYKRGMGGIDFHDASGGVGVQRFQAVEIRAGTTGFRSVEHPAADRLLELASQ